MEAGRPIVLFGAVAALNGCVVLCPRGHVCPLCLHRPKGFTSSALVKLGAGDEVTDRIYNRPQLSGSFVVHDSGMLDIPLLGLVHAAGGNPEALA